MAFCYTLFPSRVHALLIDRKMKSRGVACDITFIPRQLSHELCNLGIKFDEKYLKPAKDILAGSGITGYAVYREILSPDTSTYVRVLL